MLTDKFIERRDAGYWYEEIDPSSTRKEDIFMAKFLSDTKDMTKEEILNHRNPNNRLYLVTFMLIRKESEYEDWEILKAN